jgi:hypothetical protein
MDSEKKRKHTPEGLEKIRQSQRGKVRTPEHRKAMSDAMIAFWQRVKAKEGNNGQRH